MIHEFIHRSDRIVNVYGISLGGALSILRGEGVPDKTVIHRHAAPGKLPFLPQRINGKNVYHNNDIVIPTLGFFHPDMRLYRAITAEDPSHKA